MRVGTDKIIEEEQSCFCSFKIMKQQLLDVQNNLENEVGKPVTSLIQPPSVIYAFNINETYPPYCL